MVTLDLFNVKADGLRGITLASPEGELPSQGSSPVLFVGIEKCTQLAGAAPRSESAVKRAGLLFADGRKECGETDRECHSGSESARFA